MATVPENWVPKVHPLTRDAEAADPMELIANPVGGDPEYMLQCLLEEFAWMDCGTDDLLQMFSSPAYPVLHELMQHFGEADIRHRIDTILEHRGKVRITEKIADDDPELEEDHGPELVQVSLGRIRRT